VSQPAEKSKKRQVRHQPELLNGSSPQSVAVHNLKSRDRLDESLLTDLHGIAGLVTEILPLDKRFLFFGALCSQTVRQYMETEAGKKVFRRTYEEALSVALAIGTRLERLAVDPIPPGWPSNFAAEEHYESWAEAVIAFYGDIKPSMLQDLERGRKTEIDFINGYVVALGHASGMLVHMNAAITNLVHQIERGVLQPTRERMNELADQTCERP